MYKILIVEDDINIAKKLKEHFEKWGYEASFLTDFKTVLDGFLQQEPHLVLMDLSLPFFNGYHWCEEIRKISKVPIVFISSAGENMNIVMAMNMGGDDYVTKPFDLEVLIAKVQALIRRTYDFQGQTHVIANNDVILNLNETTLSYQDHKMELTKNEFKILQILMENKGKVVTRDAIMVCLWENDDFIDDNTLTVNVARLRKKMEEIGLLHFIKTKKGLGYMVDSRE